MHSKKPQNKFGTKKNRKINFALQEPQNQFGLKIEPQNQFGLKIGQQNQFGLKSFII